MDTIYVLNRDGRPLMPMHSWGRVQRFLKSGRASVVSSLPFTIRLKKQIEDPELDRCILGIDPGRTNIGLCVTDGKGKLNDRWIALDAADHTLEKAQSRFTLLHHNTGIVFV